MGLKYRLVLASPINHEVLLLYDNHHPKGPHVHRGLEEQEYKFENVETLLQDFYRESEQEEKRYEDKKNRN